MNQHYWIMRRECKKCFEVGRSVPLSRVVRGNQFRPNRFAAKREGYFNALLDHAARQGRLAPPRRFLGNLVKIGMAIVAIVAVLLSPLTSAEEDLVTPTMTDDAPAAGKRVRQVAPEYEGTAVYHSLYLPTDWKPKGKFPVIVEYTGNKFPPANGSGEIKDANLGYGMSDGRGFIWIAMPYIEVGKKENAVKWWGDKDATVNYCKTNLPRICKEFGGDPNNVIVCGFSRGAIGASYIGLADDEIAELWKGMFTHDHFDGQKKWGYPESDRASALLRLARLKGRSVHISGNRTGASTMRDGYLVDHLDLADFTFLDVPVAKIFTIPEGRFNHAHTDLWMHRKSPQRVQARAWLQRVIGAGEATE